MFLVYLFLALLVQVAEPFGSSHAPQLDVHFQDQCTQRCPFQNKTEEGNFDVGCENECKIEQCSRGCQSWQRALESSCQNVCNGTQDLLPPKELYCIMGCNYAVNRYLQILKDEIGTPPAPALVADTLTATSLSLEWEGSRFSNISYLVQWRYEELAGAWQYCRNQSWGPHSTVLVENLQPYTKYRFRIAILLSHHSEPIVSEPSVVISTLPSGVPSSAPTIVRATAVDSSRISVSWEPGPFPNGPVLSYVLQINELPEGYSALKDIPASESTDFYMFKNLEPNRNYTLSVCMRNGVGEGPPAITLVSTPPEPTVKDTLQPVLILGAHHTVLRQEADMLEEPVIMYNTSHVIKGVAIHVSHRLLFVSDSAGYVSRSSLTHYAAPTTILTPSHANFLPLDLSVDWLNDQLYMLGQVTHSTGPMWQMARCGLDGRGLTIAVAGFLTKPYHIEVDPYNGYLFWVIRNTTRGGLYRLDLADISNGVKHEVRPDLILEDPNLGAFTVDHKNFRLLVPNHTQNTVVSVSLDGREIVDLRANTQQPMFQNVVSLAMANGLFYWTNGELVLTEEYHPGHNSYFHSAYPDLSDRSFVSVSVNLPTSQPIPIPVNPPTNVQAILGAELAKTSWQMPHLLGGQGKGAWQNWSYELHIRDETTCLTIYRRDVNTTSYTIQNLKENTEYVIKTAAYTSSGRGPWSSEFRGKTLKIPQDGKYASILWSAAEGLLKSDVTGENVETLIHNTNLKDIYGNYHITDIAWYKDKLYLVTNTTHVYWYNLTSHDTGQLREMDSVGSIAVDWIGKKLYWSNPKQQLITRGNLNGAQQEPLPILTVAKELNIDAIQAYIYWSTGHAVECARLNGKNRRTYYPAELFSGKQVMGLTLDVDQRAVYWIVRSYEGSTLFRAPTAEEIPHGEEIFPKRMSLQHPHMQGPLCYFSDHLLWLQDDRNGVIGDLNGQNTAVISGTSLSGLNMVAVLDPVLHHYPNKYTSYQDDVNVIPEPVRLSSIHITGTWDQFSISWDPVTNVNYDKVFYEVKMYNISKMDFSEPKVTGEPYVSYRNLGMAPYSRLQITLKAFTYWGASPQVRTIVYSPQSVPTEPTNPRVFVSYSRNPVRNDQDVLAVFRWDPPTNSNGIVEGYKVKCWYSSSGKYINICDSPNLDAAKLEFTAYNLSRNSTYYFQVQAYTSVGNGALTDPVRADTDVEMPVPKLLLSTLDAVKITDCDKHENQTLSRSSGPPVDLAFISHENRLFWLSEMQELLSSKLDGRNRTKIVTLNSTGLSIAVDWVARYIYWSETGDRPAGSTIYRLDLNQAERGQIYASKVLSRPMFIHSIDISPFKSTLFWIEMNTNGAGYLMTSKTDGTMIRPFFNSIRRRRRNTSTAADECTCPESPSVGKAMTIDQTDSSSLQVLWVDSLENHVYLSEASGCFCTVLVNATINTDAGLPPTSLTTDHRLLYWSNETEGKVYSVVKTGEDSVMASMSRGVMSVNITGVRRIAALGPHLQPYPVPKCLSPRQAPLVVNYVSHTDRSITLELPNPERYPECENISLASVEYTVTYGQIKENENLDCITDKESCSMMVTYNQILEVPNLKPFSSYIFHVALKNYYSDLEGITPVTGPPTAFQTAAGAPSSPQNVTVVVLNPTTIEVQWLPPQEFNDEKVWYEVHWCTERMVAGLRQKTDNDFMNTDSLKNVHRANLRNLQPGETYRIWVRANSQNSKTYSDSDGVVIKTYPEPNNITLLHATPYALNISWIPSKNVSIVSYDIQFREAGSGNWNSLLQESEDTTVYFVEHLLPKTHYIFRLSLIYPHSSIPYIWPPDERFTYESLGDCPSPPGIPVVQHLRRDVYQVIWDPSRENGAHIELYSLEGKIEGGKREKREVNLTIIEDHGAARIEDNIIDTGNEDDNDNWVLYYNGTENYWIITDLSPSLKYVFRVRSMNKYGWSDFSISSESFDFTEAAMLAKQQELGIVLGISIPIVAVAICITGMFILMYVFQRREKEKKDLQVVTLSTVTRGPDVELATLRELPRRGNFVHNTNALYTTADIPTDEEIALLPHIRRDQITLTKFLGSGAFGEVFEGNARNLANSGGAETKVAIKTLRKGATEQEKAEFLKEAQLMSNFKHEHILQLLGVCLDNDPNFIIMELMENGDLLSYLRSNRPLLYTGNSLTLLDLLAMCVDVARGCRYLEEMHFVHRDLACRNCLVSSGDPQTRIVKIGDFGLARDIYKNDYYRKEGEGLLPVRWMAPESLVDGVFTCQSDVWAFGVLIWEIMTLGQQPYPARTNLEVLHYVRNGGRLGRPNNCPEELHQLMLKCWNYNPETRPTFKYCLEVLEELKSKSADLPLIAVQNGHYVSRTQNGSSWKTGSDAGSRDRVPFLQTSPDIMSGQAIPAVPTGRTVLEGIQTTTPTNFTPTEIPMYLELIYNNDTVPTAEDGYEIPRVIPIGGTNNKTTPSNETVDRPRTFSTSSTISDGSASTPVLYQQAQLLCSKVDESNSTGKPDSILLIKSNGCIGGIRKNVTDFRRNGEKDLSSLEQLLPSVKKCNNTVNNIQLSGGCEVDTKSGVNNNIKTNIAYSNMVKQPLLEEELKENSLERALTSSNDTANTLKVSLNYTPTTPLS
ncbi:proto-oncogene tyrosine-protein kinase ROS isoform X2 [Periplaneta americana]|uniref:proto-oncogene tyrosine-protein kinase ROS isoform X2 n=1 Tax=Periplaneta americana TaxID=6978 RepID=UPI0037E8C53D